MRDELCAALVRRSVRENMVFLTGDLGFGALEPLQAAMGDRFINCGVAEQNMISVGAALASEGFEVWAYSIAPFCYARPFEQIRNDVCLHRTSMRLLGNGGGYGYGVMGPTHHALEDYGVLLTLPGMEVYSPSFADDVDAVIDRAGDSKSPCYVRLGRCELPKTENSPDYAPWRRLLHGDGAIVLAVGPLAGVAMAALADTDASLWVLTEGPITRRPPPPPLVEEITARKRLCVYEEHVAHGGVGSMMAMWLLGEQISMERFRVVSAFGYLHKTTGSQAFLREHSGIGPRALADAYREVACR